MLVQPQDEGYRIVCSINYKHIIEMQEYVENENYNKYNLKASNTLQIKYVKSYENYQDYIIMKWKALEHKKNDTFGFNGLINGVMDPSQYLSSILLKFPQGEQACLDFRHNFIELKRQILIGE